MDAARRLCRRCWPPASQGPSHFRYADVCWAGLTPQPLADSGGNGGSEGESAAWGAHGLQEKGWGLTFGLLPLWEGS